MKLMEQGQLGAIRAGRGPRQHAHTHPLPKIWFIEAACTILNRGLTIRTGRKHTLEGFFFCFVLSVFYQKIRFLTHENV